MKNDKGQYFTKNEMLKEKLCSFILNNPNRILEPSVGRGDLVDFVVSKYPDINFDMYEIDASVELLGTIQKNIVIYGDFLKQHITQTYKTIIGNPPFIKKPTGNLYIDFIKKCYALLEPAGELVFIVPSDFLKLTCAVKILNEMMLNGTFTHIFHPHDEKLFENASIDVIIFRYCKNELLEKTTLYNEKFMYISNSDGLITFSENKHIDTIRFNEYFNVYVGMVSGKEGIYKNKDLGNIEVLNGENKKEKYIYIDKYPCGNKEIDEFLLNNKQCLMRRGIKKYNELNWFEWGAPRNITSIEENINKECIYLCNLTRAKNVAFAGNVCYFGGSLIMLIPKKSIDLSNIIKYLNSSRFKDNFIFSDRFKIGHRQISNSYIPTEYL